MHAGHFDLIVVLDKHDTSYSGTVLENAVMLGDTADDDIKNLPLAYVIDPCSQSSSLSNDEAATSQSEIQTSSDPAASMELTCDVDTAADSETPARASQSTDSYTSLDSASQNDSSFHVPGTVGHDTIRDPLACLPIGHPTSATSEPQHDSTCKSAGTNEDSTY